MAKKIAGIQKYSSWIGKYSFVIAIVWISLSWTAFYPYTHVSIDELEYVTNAQRLVTGNLQQECTTAVGNFETGRGYCISKYNIGTSLFYLPVVFLSSLVALPGSIALPALLALFIGALGFRKLLILQKLPSWLSLLYLFYPAFIYFSRTRYSEMFSAAIITWILYLAFKLVKQQATKLDQLVLGGLVVLALSVRYTNAISILLLGIAVGCQLIDIYTLKFFSLKTYIASLSSRIWAAIVTCRFVFFSLIPLSLLLFSFNNWLYGGIFRSGYFFSNEEGLFVISQMPQVLLLFTLALLIIYPGMLASLFWHKSSLKWGIVAAVTATIVFYSAFPYVFFEGKLFDLIFGIRFLIPITPLILFSYAQVLTKLVPEISDLNSKLSKLLLLLTVLMILSLALAVPVISLIHKQFLDTAEITTNQQINK